MVAFKDGLVDGFLSRASQRKQAGEAQDNREIFESVGAGAA